MTPSLFASSGVQRALSCISELLQAFPLVDLEYYNCIFPIDLRDPHRPPLLVDRDQSFAIFVLVSLFQECHGCLFESGCSFLHLGFTGGRSKIGDRVDPISVQSSAYRDQRSRTTLVTLLQADVQCPLSRSLPFEHRRSITPRAST